MQSAFNVIVDNYEDYYLDHLEKLDDLEKRTKTQSFSNMMKNLLKLDSVYQTHLLWMYFN